ncbi:hypothetical protein OB905_10960 [Halobacteria archaeon AArc-dxtr1]|nr:hypothetical protein [Halobacteria archaeon AArc-dxtr1]
MSDATPTGADVLQKQPATDFDLVFEILSNRRRRIVLRTLFPVEMEDVKTLSSEVSRYVDADRQTVDISLRHTHLPKLDDAGIVDYDRQSEVVQYDGHQLIDEALAHTEAEDLAPA